MGTILADFVLHFTSAARGSAIRQLIDQSWTGITKTHEIPALKDYLSKSGVGVDFLNAKLSPLLNSPQFHVKFAGVFCHKKPIVQRTVTSISANAGDTAGCELGDLLTLFVLLDSTDKLQYLSGSLFQAKVKQRLDSKSQRYLYDDDADFVLPANLGGHTRLMPKYSEGRGRALRYLILNSGHHNPVVGCRHTPWNTDYQPRWSTYLYGLLAGYEGLTVRGRMPSSKKNAWELIVDDLLGVAAKVPAGKPPRGTDIAVQVATGHFNSFLDSSVSCVNTDEEGVSILMVIAHAHSNR